MPRKVLRKELARLRKVKIRKDGGEEYVGRAGRRLVTVYHGHLSQWVKLHGRVHPVELKSVSDPTAGSYYPTYNLVVSREPPPVPTPSPGDVFKFLDAFFTKGEYSQCVPKT